MTRRAWIMVAVIAVVLVLFVACASGGSGPIANAAPLTGEGPVAPPKDFTDTARQLSPQETSLIAGVGGANPCWVWKQGWHHWNPVGIDQYKFSVDVEWCANANKTKVTKVVYNYCLDLGGYFEFDWCHKQKGATGYATIGMYSDWHYHFVANSIATSRHPSVRFDLYATGRVVGTVYYDN